MTPAKKKHIRVRFAPSPTGPVNLGTSRTALFNWLFAKNLKGDFILRIEDTDKERSKKEYEENIFWTLEWLGFRPDEIYRQSERAKIYEKHLTEMLEKGVAYYCFCSEEELDAERESQLASGVPPKYSGRCRSIPKEEAAARAKKERAVIRFKIPEKKYSFTDGVRGKVTFDAGLIGDIVIAKSVSEPLYNFAVVVDDHDMEITHVIRGEDHISNTPKQLAIAEGLGFSRTPEFSHLPLILGPDKKKLSKRYLATSVKDYAGEGYVAPAVLNFLALLGWHPREDREVISVEDMVKEFSIDRVQKAGAVFNPEKLEWLNSHYLREMPAKEFVEAIAEFVPESWKKPPEKFARVMLLARERMRKLADARTETDFLFEMPEYESSLIPWKGGSLSDAKEILEKAYAVMEEIPEGNFSKEAVSEAVMPLAEKEGRGVVLWPLRVSLTGRAMSPGPFECAEALGKKETLSRITAAIKKI